jgi:hypothetical protein
VAVAVAVVVRRARVWAVDGEKDNGGNRDNQGQFLTIN